MLNNELNSMQNNKLDLSTLRQFIKSDLTGKSITGLDRGHIYWEITEDNMDNYLIYYRPQLYFYLGGVFTVISFVGLTLSLLIKVFKDH